MKHILNIFLIFLNGNVLADNQYYELSPYWLVGDNLYTNKSDELFYQTYRLMNGNKELIYLKRFGVDFGQIPLEKKLHEVIDANSWTSVGTHFYRDKNNLYCFHTQTIGGMLVKMPGFNPDKLLYLDGNYWLTYEKMIQKYNYSKKDTLSLYISDGENVYYICKKIEEADFSSFHLSVESKSSAEDANNKYEGSFVIKK